MRKIRYICILLLSAGSLCAQDYPQWPAERPETEEIASAQDKQTRLDNRILPQEIGMQDHMRSIFIGMMRRAATELGWEMAEISEYTNDNPMQGSGTPYALRSPRGIEITFQFIVNQDSLAKWRKDKRALEARKISNQQTDQEKIQAITKSSQYRNYTDSAHFYMNLYTTYLETHQDEGASLYTKDRHPKYYQQKETDFLNKANAMISQSHDHGGTAQGEKTKSALDQRLANHTIVSAKFIVNDFEGAAVDQTLGPVRHTSIPYVCGHATYARLYSIPAGQANCRWHHILLILLGAFHTSGGDQDHYQASFNRNGQGDEHTPKKIRSDQVQNISISLCGEKDHIERLRKFIDVAKLNTTIVNIGNTHEKVN